MGMSVLMKYVTPQMTLICLDPILLISFKFLYSFLDHLTDLECTEIDIKMNMFFFDSL